MKIIKTYKYKLKLTNHQKNTIESWIGTCRFIYNLAKETKDIAYFGFGKILHKSDLSKQLVDLKQINWIKSVPSQTLQNVVFRLSLAYENYFRKLKNGELQTQKSEYVSKILSKGLLINENKLRNFGKPKWAKKDEYNSIVFNQNKQRTIPRIRINDNKITLPKIGELKFNKDRIPTGKIKTATIKKEHGAYFMCVTFETESKNLYPTSENQAVGIDVGINKFATDSNETHVQNPRITEKNEKKLRVKNRELARKKVGSNGFIKVKQELNKLHHKIQNQRQDFAHKLSLKYVKNNSLICVEDLKVKNMIQNKNLSSQIADVSWSRFFGMLKYKCEHYEKEFIQVNAKYTSQKCFNCGHIAKENRKTQEHFECVMCGHKDNADFNAAKNILGEGIALKRKREALACA